jgi:hypothetical protein
MYWIFIFQNDEGSLKSSSYIQKLPNKRNTSASSFCIWCSFFGKCKFWLWLPLRKQQRTWRSNANQLRSFRRKTEVPRWQPISSLHSKHPHLIQDCYSCCRMTVPTPKSLKFTNRSYPNFAELDSNDRPPFQLPPSSSVAMLYIVIRTRSKSLSFRESANCPYLRVHPGGAPHFEEWENDMLEWSVMSCF